MKLSQLNTAIRQMKGAPKTAAFFRFFDGRPDFQLRDLEFTKQSLLEALKTAFPEGRSAETGLTLTVDGHLILENREGVTVGAWGEVVDDPSPVEDLLGGDDVEDLLG